MTEYEASTTGETADITATAEDENATVTLELGGVEATSPVTWEEGENVLTITVENGDETETYTVTVTKTTPDARLSELKIGALTLAPSFDPDITEYTTTTSNATNTITATAQDEDATISLELNGVEATSPVTWEEGENVLTITVENGDESETYTVTVTKSTPNPEG